MPDLDVLAPNYRRARERWPDAPNLSNCHDSLIACFDGNAHGLVEHVKSFIESVCVTIINEFGESMPSSRPSTTQLLVAALQPLGLQNTRGASKLDKVLSGFNVLTEALSDMRNNHGPLAHGKDGFVEAVTADHARAFMHTGDAILSVLLNALEGMEPDLNVTREPYDHFPHLNERIDRAVGVEARVDEDGNRSVVVLAVTMGPRDNAIEIRIEPSRLLYGIDRPAYIEILRASVTVISGLDEDEDSSTAADEAELPKLAVAPSSPPLTEVVPGYDGRLAALRPALERFLDAEGSLPAEAPSGGVDLADSLLATADNNMGLDWKEREPLQARLKVALKRVLVQFGVDAKASEETAARLVAWMRIQVPEPV